MMTNGDHEGRVFLSHCHTNTCSTLPYFIFEKHEKSFQKILNSPRFKMVMSFEHYNDVTDRHAASVPLLDFYLSHGLVRLCEIEFSQMGKNNRNYYLV